MPTFVAAKDSALLVGEYNLGSYINQWRARKTTKLHDVTMVGNQDDVFIAGPSAGEFSIQGGWAADAGGSEAALVAVMAAAVNTPISLFPPGMTLGNRVTLGKAIETDYEINGSTDEAVMYSAAFGVSSPLLGGWSLHALASETTDTNTAAVDALALSNFGGVGHLHVTAVTGSTPSMTLRIQDSADGSTGWADIVTFTAITAAGSEQIQMAAGTTVERYLRAIWTMTGTSPDFTFAVAFGRNKR